MATKKKTKEIEIPRLETDEFTVKLISDTPLVCHGWSIEAIKRIAIAQGPKVKKDKKLPPRDPDAEYESSKYIHPDGGYGFPAMAFKKAAVRASKSVGQKMIDIKTGFHVIPDIGTRLIKLKCSNPYMGTDPVRLSNGVRDLRYRVYFNDWSVSLKIVYDTNVLSDAQIINFLNIAGFGIGVGDWRPECDGTNGRFHVDLKEKT